jgi:hypothetical protein
MKGRQGPVTLLGKIGFFALIGLAAVFLAGPVLTLLSLVLSFGLLMFSLALPLALIGLLVWVPLRALFQGTAVAWKDTQEIGKGMWAFFVVPIRSCARGAAGTMEIGQRVQRRIHGLACCVRGVFVETICACLVGGFLGALITGSTRQLGVSILFGTLTGAVLGILVGVSGLRAAQELPEQSTPEPGLTL